MPVSFVFHTQKERGREKRVSLGIFQASRHKPQRAERQALQDEEVKTIPLRHATFHSRRLKPAGSKTGPEPLYALIMNGLTAPWLLNLADALKHGILVKNVFIPHTLNGLTHTWRSSQNACAKL